MAPSGDLKIRYRLSNLMLNCFCFSSFAVSRCRNQAEGLSNNGLVVIIDSMQAHGILAATELSAVCKYFRAEKSSDPRPTPANQGMQTQDRFSGVQEGLGKLRCLSESGQSQFARS